MSGFILPHVCGCTCRQSRIEGLRRKYGDVLTDDAYRLWVANIGTKKAGHYKRLLQIALAELPEHRPTMPRTLIIHGSVFQMYSYQHTTARYQRLPDVHNLEYVAKKGRMSPASRMDLIEREGITPTTRPPQIKFDIEN